HVLQAEIAPLASRANLTIDGVEMSVAEVEVSDEGQRAQRRAGRNIMCDPLPSVRCDGVCRVTVWSGPEAQFIRVIGSRTTGVLEIPIVPEDASGNLVRAAFREEPGPIEGLIERIGVELDARV